jgi:hypothetical protein
MFVFVRIVISRSCFENSNIAYNALVQVSVLRL